MIAILDKYISYASLSNDIVTSNKLFDLLRKDLGKYNLTVRMHNSQGWPSLVASTRQSKYSKLMLQAHMDVVPAFDNAFSLTERNGKLYGRGVYDMKFAAACYLQLAEDLKDELDKYDFGIMLTSDEEVGGENGVGYLLDQGYSADVCILPDGGNDWAIETGCNGVWMVELLAKGKAAHGSRPWEGDNAIEKLMDALTQIRSIFGECKPHAHSLTIGQISGGEAINQVPGSAKATLDIRFVDQQDFSILRKDVESVTKAAGVQLETIVYTQNCNTDTKDPYVASFIKAAEEIRGVPMETCHSFGSTDARYFSQHNIPTIVIRPVGGGHHSDEEWIDKSSLEQFYEVLKAYVIQEARIK